MSTILVGQSRLLQEKQLFSGSCGTESNKRLQFVVVVHNCHHTLYKLIPDFIEPNFRLAGPKTGKRNLYILCAAADLKKSAALSPLPEPNV